MANSQAGSSNGTNMVLALSAGLLALGLAAQYVNRDGAGADRGREEPIRIEVEDEAPARPVRAREEARPAARERPAPAAGALPAPPDVAAPPASAERTSTGLASRVLHAGTGTTHPTAASSVTVHYTGWQTDGTMFDSSRTRGEPATFPLGGVIAGWTEGLQLMVTGEERRFWIPADLAYGDPPRRPGAPGGMLVFDVELISIN